MSPKQSRDAVQGRTDSDRWALSRVTEVPLVVKQLNRHLFVYFMISNVLTGVVNVSMDTLQATDNLALLILGTPILSCVAHEFLNY